MLKIWVTLQQQGFALIRGTAPLSLWCCIAGTGDLVLPGAYVFQDRLPVDFCKTAYLRNSEVTKVCTLKSTMLRVVGFVVLSQTIITMAWRPEKERCEYNSGLVVLMHAVES